MPANRTWKRRVEVKADLAAWQRLGQLLEVRRRTIGYTWRTDFERERLVNRRMAADIEKAAPDRVDTFTNGSLGLVAQGYAVTFESMLAVLRGEADELVPVPVTPVSPDLVPVSAGVPAPVTFPVPAGPPGWMAADEKRSAANEPYADEIKRRLAGLRARGILNPSGEQLFGEGTPDARDWDEHADWGIRDRVWFIADIQRRNAARGAAPDSGTGTNGSLCRG